MCTYLSIHTYLCLHTPIYTHIPTHTTHRLHTPPTHYPDQVCGWCDQSNICLCVWMSHKLIHMRHELICLQKIRMGCSWLVSYVWVRDWFIHTMRHVVQIKDTSEHGMNEFVTHFICMGSWLIYYSFIHTMRHVAHESRKGVTLVNTASISSWRIS